MTTREELIQSASQDIATADTSSWSSDYRAMLHTGAIAKLLLAQVTPNAPTRDLENWQRLEDLLEQITSRYAPERGVTAHYIAMCLDAYGVKAPNPSPAANPRSFPCLSCDGGNGRHRGDCPNG